MTRTRHRHELTTDEDNGQRLLQQAEFWVTLNTPYKVSSEEVDLLILIWESAEDADGGIAYISTVDKFATEQHIPCEPEYAGGSHLFTSHAKYDQNSHGTHVGSTNTIHAKEEILTL